MEMNQDAVPKPDPSNVAQEGADQAEERAGQLAGDDGCDRAVCPTTQTDTDVNSALLHDGEWRRMHPGWLRCERISGWIVNACVIPVTLTGALLLVLLNDEPWWATLIICSVWAVSTIVLLWAVLWYAPRAFGAMSWAAHPDRLEFRKGVWWRKEITVPRTRVQHTDVNQGPLQRRCGIGTLVIHTAGTQYAKVEIAGLEPSLAEGLRDWLIAASQSSDGDRDDV